MGRIRRAQFLGSTPRNAVCSGLPAGDVYLPYGIHWCLNLVCGNPGKARAVDSRHEPTDGVSTMINAGGSRTANAGAETAGWKGLADHTRTERNKLDCGTFVDGGEHACTGSMRPR